MDNTESTPKKTGLARLRNSKGFSLIEIAIVLVIIGIIVAAIIKGQDLLFNSRVKQIVATANSWKLSALTYLDRNGRYPGDTDKSGVMGNAAAEKLLAGTATYEIANTLANAPPNPVIIGGQSYWFYFGYSPVAVGDRNVIVICPSKDCTTPLTPDDVEMFKSLDTSIDGGADAGIGLMRGIVTSGAGVTTLAAAPGARDNAVVVMAAAGADIVDATTAGTTSPWIVTTQFGAVWAFDKQF